MLSTPAIRARRNRGVTLVELLVAMVSASVLALTASIILIFCFVILR